MISLRNEMKNFIVTETGLVLEHFRVNVVVEGTVSGGVSPFRPTGPIFVTLSESSIISQPPLVVSLHSQFNLKLSPVQRSSFLLASIVQVGDVLVVVVVVVVVVVPVVGVVVVVTSGEQMVVVLPAVYENQDG